MRKTTFILASAMMTLAFAAYARQTAAQKPQASTSGTPAAPAAKTAKPPAAKAAPATAEKSPAAPALATQKDKASYALGLNIGVGLHRDGVDIDPDIMMRGIKDSIAGNKPALTDDEINAALQELQTEVKQRQQEEQEKAAVANKAAGDAFLAANKSKDGVVTLASGLQYKILTQGTGPKPSATDTVICNYRGTLLDGTEFDSSYKRGQPVTFPVDQVIRGWSEALPLMSVGSKWQLFIPSDLAYGERSPGPEIGPNSTLIFEVELVSIKAPDAKDAAPAPQSK